MPCVLELFLANRPDEPSNPANSPTNNHPIWHLYATVDYIDFPPHIGSPPPSLYMGDLEVDTGCIYFSEELTRFATQLGTELTRRSELTEYLTDRITYLTKGLPEPSWFRLEVSVFETEIGMPESDEDICMTEPVEEDYGMEIGMWESEEELTNYGMVSAAEEAIEELLTAAAAAEYDGEDCDCPICACPMLADEYDCEEVKVMAMPCKHWFHEGCIVKWLNRSDHCPICRFKMPTEEMKWIQICINV